MFFCNTDRKIQLRMNNQLIMWRTDLSKYEKEQFIPFMINYIDGFIDYFNIIHQRCIDCENNQIFWPQLEILLEKFGQPTDEVGARLTARNYYLQIRVMIESSYLTPLIDLKKQFQAANSLGNLALSLNILKSLSSSILNVKEKMFLFKLTGWFAIRNLESGTVFDPLPSPALTIFFVPFQSALENLLTESTYLLGSIDQWSKEQLEWKTSYLNALNSELELKNTKWAIWINLITIVVAIILSWVFLFATPPFEKLRLEIENSKYKVKLEEYESEINKYKTQMYDIQNQNTAPKQSPGIKPNLNKKQNGK